MEGVEIGRGRLIVLARLRKIAERLVRPPDPILAARVTERAVGRARQRLEMAERQLGVAEVPERQPAGEERCVLAGIGGKRAGAAHQLVGGLRLAGLQGGIGVRAPLLPPSVRLGEIHRLGLDQHGLPGLFGLFLPPQRLRALHRQAPVGIGILGVLGDQLRGVLGAQEHCQPCLGLLLLLAGEQRNHPADDGGALLALTGPAAVIEQKPIEAPLVLGRGQQRSDPLQERGLQAGRDVELGPGLDGECLGPRLVLVGEMGGRERGEPGRGPGLLVAEERLDVPRACLARQQRLLGALIEQPPVGPVRIGVEEGAHVLRRSVAAAIEVPVDELAPGRIGDLLPHGHGLRHLPSADGGNRLAQAACILGRDRMVADRRDGRVIAGDVLSLLGQRTRQGRRLQRRHRLALGRRLGSRGRGLRGGLGFRRRSRFGRGRFRLNLGGGVLAGCWRTGNDARQQEGGQRLR